MTDIRESIKNKPYSKDERIEMITMYKNGMSIRHVAEVFGRSYGGVHNTLQQAGVEMRERGKFSPAVRRTREAEKAELAEKTKNLS